ncbi:MAG TPA: single-stranded-DNA-specific exonuclease RecJ [Solimonas sp.]|nr:single-stranded-DNA-specific exonuclease RecJ [Solimonas sp.]
MHPVLRRVYAARGVTESELPLELARLLPPAPLRGLDQACAILEAAIRGGRRIVIAGDYDADGATGTAVAILGLRALGASDPGYVVPNRFRMGYGLSPALAELAAAQGAQVLVTVDNGIASNAGVEHARRLGMQVVITDHHLPGALLPAADAIVNPNQPGCGFPSKHLAGVGVMFYLLLALRARLRQSGWFADRPEPRLGELLDLVAVGTVADVVRLDHNNRVLVEHGLARIRGARARPGIRALLLVAGRDPARITSTDLGFVLGPRINAAGRLDDIRTGIECLLAADDGAALELARALDRLNRERREIEAQMCDEAVSLAQAQDGAVGVCLFDASWHEGVVGLVASRIKEQRHRPVIAFARAQETGVLKGSGRSIAGLHLRDALVAIDAAEPGLLVRYGGHAMAAGLTLREADLANFVERFDRTCRGLLDAAALERVVETDGELAAAELSLDTARALMHAGPWGQGFPEPLFEGTFQIAEARLVGGDQTHVRYRLRSADGPTLDAMDFGGAARLRAHGPLRAAYTLSVNRYQGLESLDLHLKAMEP